MSETKSYIIELMLETSSNDDLVLKARFNIIHHITNVMVKHAKGMINQLERDIQYRQIMNNRKSKKFTKEEKQQLIDLRLKYGLSEYQFHKYVVTQKKIYEKHISIHVAQKIASKVWKSVDKYLFSNGKEIHFKKKQDVNSFEGKSNTTGIRFKDGYICTNGLKLKTKYRKNDKYIKCALNNDRIKYCRIKRRWHKHQYRYYVDLIMEGIPNKTRNYGIQTLGIDIGPSTIAVVSDDECILQELAHNVNSIEQELRKLQRHRDRENRVNNPNNFNEDGTVIKGKHKWYRSKRMKLTDDKIKSLYQKRANQLKEAHNLLANKIISMGTDIVVEDIDWVTLAKKAKNTEKSLKTGKFKRKKRFGKSIANHAPSKLIELINTKLSYIDKKVTKVDCFKTAATKFNHSTGEYMNVNLRDRYVNIDNNQIQRDLHSAFNLKHILITKTKDEIIYDYNLEAMNQNFEQFINNHNTCINELIKQKQLGVKFPSCMSI